MRLPEGAGLAAVQVDLLGLGPPAVQVEVPGRRPDDNVIVRVIVQPGDLTLH